MNKNTLIGLLLIGIILIGFTWYNSSQVEKQIEAQQKEQAYQDSVQRAWEAANPDTAAMQKAAAQELTADSTLSRANAFGMPTDSSMLSKAMVGTEQFTVLENKVMKVTFSNLAARVASVELKDYKRLYDKYKGDPLKLFFPDGSDFGLEFYTPTKVNTSNRYFTIARQSEHAIAYRLYADSASYIEYIYTMAPNDYMMDMKVDVSHFKNTLVTNQSDIKLSWNIISPQEEKGFKNENNYTTVAYKFPAETSVEELSPSTGEASEELTTKVQWVAFKQQFFSSIIIAKDNFQSATVGYNTFQPGDSNIKAFQSEFLLPYGPQTEDYEFSFYFGPNKYSIMDSYEGLELQELIPLGWGIIGWVNKWLVIPTFDFLEKYITSYGIIILLLTIFIKIIISPLTYKSYMSSAKMRLLKPDIDKLTEKYPKKEDAMKKQQAMMALYKSAGVSPMGGCLPMLIQFPILIAMFRFFPSSIELRGQTFLWADDLSSYDSIWTFPDGFSIPFYGDHISLLTLLMAVSLFVTSKLNMSQQPGGQQMPGMKFMMLYMMPVMLLFWFNDYASGLSYYYLLANLITIAQTYAFRYFVNDQKLHARMKATAAKPQKKSKWAERMEQMQKNAQAQQQTRKK